MATEELLPCGRNDCLAALDQPNGVARTHGAPGQHPLSAQPGEAPYRSLLPQTLGAYGWPQWRARPEGGKARLPRQEACRPGIGGSNRAFSKPSYGDIEQARHRQERRARHTDVDSCEIDLLQAIIGKETADG
jgi:hypothetical protein